ncbi:RNA-binding S4 domain-containing protein [Corynebacterium aquatimens]|uniref:Ribosome-associated protein YbcJ (S4-like RNA binding protein) n=2 Tax=Corynebacterium aquatimens TaxID=1190508 RepID=A0A931DW51_9CORY|nr:RNA-binding S4 domain-containing protein [Corynebacterium aquatimens]MBG6122604.1 ribosome-associated protein YbcJ (S4-like RNA binding protein) [Corynebacterium aquatimens]WJY64856.1 ribosome-associated protein [Corynebacterium aquatimens]
MEIEISGSSIKLGQFLKLANIVETGGHAKEVIADGEVTVNGEVVTARGHMLHDGDVVSVSGIKAVVATGSGDYFDERTADDDFDPEKWRNL